MAVELAAKKDDAASQAVRLRHETGTGRKEDGGELAPPNSSGGQMGQVGQIGQVGQLKTLCASRAREAIDKIVVSIRPSVHLTRVTRLG